MQIPCVSRRILQEIRSIFLCFASFDRRVAFRRLSRKSSRMSRPSFWYRLSIGQLNRWEQALAGGITGLVCGLMFTWAIVASTADSRGPDTMTIPEAALTFGLIGAIFGTILGAKAPVFQDCEFRHPDSTDHLDASVKTYIVAFVWPKQHSTPESLRALGEELISWRKDKPAVTSISGLDRLLAGLYPYPNGPTPYVEDPEGEPSPWPQRSSDGRRVELVCRKMKVIDPWFFCPVLIWADERMGADDTIQSLRKAITPELVSSIGYSFG